MLIIPFFSRSVVALLRETGLAVPSTECVGEVDLSFESCWMVYQEVQYMIVQ